MAPAPAWVRIFQYTPVHLPRGMPFRPKPAGNSPVGRTHTNTRTCTTRTRLGAALGVDAVLCPLDPDRGLGHVGLTSLRPLGVAGDCGTAQRRDVGLMSRLDLESGVPGGQEAAPRRRCTGELLRQSTEEATELSELLRRRRTFLLSSPLRQAIGYGVGRGKGWGQRQELKHGVWSGQGWGLG